MDTEELRSALRAFVNTLQVEGEHFRHNESTDYGRITIELWTGAGDPFHKFAGDACMSRFYRRGLQPNGRYKLNDAFVDWLLERILEAKSKQPEGT